MEIPWRRKKSVEISDQLLSDDSQIRRFDPDLILTLHRAKHFANKEFHPFRADNKSHKVRTHHHQNIRYCSQSR
jgi:hypothetical protein